MRANINENDSHCNSQPRTAVYICVCNAVTDREIRQAAALGVTSLQQLKDALGVATCCGRCEGCVHQILQEESDSTGATIVA